MNDGERFWSKVEKGAGCWDWLGVKTKRGYGYFSYGFKKILAHRASYSIHFGEIPEGMCVCHHCDNPSCVRPDHLFLGTRSDNTRDMFRKKRDVHSVCPERVCRGSSHPSAKLNEDKVFRLRRIYMKGCSADRMALWLGMNDSTLFAAVTGKKWKHVPMPLHERETYEEALRRIAA